MSEYSYNADAKEATAFTKQHNAAFAQQFAIDLEDAYNSEVALARRGCLKKLDGFRLKDKTGNVVWDLQAYDFLKQQAVADTVHPSLWLNGKANIEAGVFEVLAGKIYQVRGIDVANLTFVRSKTGWIVIDVTTNTEAAAYGLRITEEVLGENIHDHIRAVIISQSHADHFGGIKGIVSPQQVGKAEGQVRIYVPAGFDEETVKENVYAGTAMFHRSKYQFGGDLFAGPKGRVSTGLGLGTSSGTLSYITPTDFIAEDTTLTIDGLEVEFQLTPGTEAPAEMNNYFPEYRAFWAAENCTGTLHNLYPIRGAQLRDAANWWRFTAIALERYGKQADVVFQSHNWPHWNTPETPHSVEDFLRNNAAVYKYIHDRTLHLANQGRTAKEIAREVVLPEKLAKVWYTRPYYGSVEINARAVYCKYLGFYNGNPTELNALTETEEAELFVEYVGSVEQVLHLAEQDYAAGNYRRAAKAASYAVFVEPSNQRARLLNADALEQLAYQSESGIWRNAYLNGAFELRNGTSETVRRLEQDGKNDLIQNMTPRMVLDYLGIVTDGEKLADADFRFRLQLVTNAAGEPIVWQAGEAFQVQAEFAVHVYHGTILYYDGHTEESLPLIRIAAAAFPAITAKNLETLLPFVETEHLEYLQQIHDAVVDLNQHSQFALIEPNRENH